MPQPFLRQPGQVIDTSPGVLPSRPACAIKIATIASEWARIERVMASLFGNVTGHVFKTAADTATHTNNVPALRAFEAIQNLHTRITVFKAATDAFLDDLHRAEFEKLAQALRQRAKDRNDVVHGLWCAVDKYPNDVLLSVDSSTTDFVRYTEADLQAIIGRIILTGRKLSNFGSSWMWKQFGDAGIQLGPPAPTPQPQDE